MTTEIQSAAIYRCTDKATKQVFYVVKSDSQAGAWYTISFDHAALAWSCDCKATKPCKHIRAVSEVLKIRRARVAAAMGGDMPATIAAIEAERDRANKKAAAPVIAAHQTKRTYISPVVSAKSREYAPLNGNRAFSLLKQ